MEPKFKLEDVVVTPTNRVGIVKHITKHPYVETFIYRVCYGAKDFDCIRESELKTNFTKEVIQVTKEKYWFRKSGGITIHNGTNKKITLEINPDQTIRITG